MKLGVASGMPDFTATACRAFQTTQRSLPLDEDAQHSAAWCNGLGGIALAWLDLADVDLSGWLGEDALTAGCKTVIRKVLECPEQPNHSLCHGEAGTLEILTQARRREWNVDPANAERALAEAVLADKIVCGTHRGQMSPGLMTGYTGVGMGLLRALAPSRVPNVLLLCGPNPIPAALAGEKYDLAHGSKNLPPEHRVHS